MTTKPKTRKAPAAKVKSQYELYPMPFFDRESHCTWKVQPTGDYGRDCSVGRDYAREFLKSCDGTVGWASLLRSIALDMVRAGPMAGKLPDGSPRSNGVIVGFMGMIGDALACMVGLAMKAPPAETAINPKLTAIAAKLDAAQAHLRVVKARDDDDPDEKEHDKAYGRLHKLEDKLAEAVATNLDEMKIKARWADIASGDYAVAASIVRDLRALSPKPEGGAYYPCEEPEP